MSTDFFDDDLLKSGSRRGSPASDAGAGRAISEEGVSKLARQREEVNTHVVDAVKEIEQLRLRQEQLEKEKKDLQELARRQEEYQAGKREIMEKLAQSITVFEKEEVQAARMTEILSVMRAKFKETLLELKGIKEESWPDDSFANELNKATVIVEDARTVYKKALAKIEAAGMNNNMSQMPAQSFSYATGGDHALKGGFLHWFKVGVAVSLPLAVILIIIFVTWLIRTGH